jgi:hypothetical protein
MSAVPKLLARWATIAALIPVVSFSVVARAAVPEPPPAPAHPPDHSDTSAFLPRWVHLHASFGVGWISSPRFIRERYEAGQDFEAGFEIRPRSALRIRLNGEYQVLPALGRVNFQRIAYTDPDGNAVADTLSFDWLGRGWMGAGRAELQWQALPHTWLLAGGGRGYLSAGQRAYHFRDPFVTLDVEFPGSSGWAWISSLGARYEFELFGPVLGAEVRFSQLDRPQDRLQTWSIRFGWQGK